LNNCPETKFLILVIGVMLHYSSRMLSGRGRAYA